MFVAWSSPEFQHYVSIWPVFTEDQDVIEIPPESLPHSDAGGILLYGNATESDAMQYLDEGRWLMRNTSANKIGATGAPSTEELMARWKRLKGPCWLQEWSRAQLSYSSQVALMEGISALIGQRQVEDPTVAKKLVFQDESFVFITHALYRALTAAEPQKQRAMVRRLHKFSRFVGTAKGCAAFKLDTSSTGELAQELEDEALCVENGDYASAPVLQWEMKLGSTWQRMKPEMEMRINQSIAEGQPHPIILDVGVNGLSGEVQQVEIDAFTGYVREVDGLDHVFSGHQRFHGFASAIKESTRTPIRTVAQNNQVHDEQVITLLLKQLGFDAHGLSQVTSQLESQTLLGLGPNLVDSFSHNVSPTTRARMQALSQLMTLMN